MRTEYVWTELYIARKELHAVEDAFHDVVVAAHNLGRPIVDQPWMHARRLFDYIYLRIDALQRACVDYAELGGQINGDKHQRQDEWAETRAAATQGMAAAGADGGAAGVNVEGGAHNGSSSKASNTAPTGISGSAILEYPPCSPECLHCSKKQEVYDLFLTADNIDNYYTDAFKKMQARAEHKLAAPKLFPQFSKMPVELQLMIWERAAQPPPCSHILGMFENPQTNDDVAEALKFFPDAGLWKASQLSLRTVLRAYNKEKTHYLTADENGNFPPCHRGTTSKTTRQAETMYKNFAALPTYVDNVLVELEGLQAQLAELLRWVKLGVTKARAELLPVVPYADEFLAAFGPILHPEWEAHNYIPLLRIQKMAANMCSEVTQSPTYSEDELRQFDEQYNVPADMSLLQELGDGEEAALDLPSEIWNDSDPDLVPASMSTG